MSLNKDQVILVNERDEWLGTMDKMEAHKTGTLHRAFSLFILNDKDELLLQQRAETKYHSGGLWSNTCCSHPAPGESTIEGAHRRLSEEMGFDCRLDPLFNLRYRAEVDNDLIENEFDHIYTGRYSKDLLVNPEEVKGYRYVEISALKEWMAGQPHLFTAWFHLAIPDFLEHINKELPARRTVVI